IERCKLLKVRADETLLPLILLEEPLRDDEGDVLPDDPRLLETVLHPAQLTRHELESRIVEETLLHTRHEAEARDLTDLAHFTEEPEIENELLIPPTTEVVEKLIDDQQEPLVRVLLLKRPHHLD